jgi:hypothetical protein
MDIAKALTFITEDERWLEKLAIGVGIVLISSFLAPLLIGLLGFFIVAGYAIRLLQNVRHADLGAADFCGGRADGGGCGAGR